MVSIIVLYYIIIQLTTVVYAVRRWPKRRYEAHTCTDVQAGSGEHRASYFIFGMTRSSKGKAAEALRWRLTST